MTSAHATALTTAPFGFTATGRPAAYPATALPASLAGPSYGPRPKRRGKARPRFR